MSTQEQRERFEAYFKKRWPEFEHSDASAFEVWQFAEADAIERCAKALCHQLLVRGSMDIGEAYLTLRVVGSCPSDEDFESAIRALLNTDGEET